MTENTTFLLLRLFRAGAIAQVLLMLIQAAFAGRLLAGHLEAVHMHEFTAKVLVLLAAFLCLVALTLRAKAIVPPWVIIAAVLLVAAEIVEFAAGARHNVALHVPLGVAIFGGALRQLLWAVRDAERSGEGSAPQASAGNTGKLHPSAGSR